MATMADVNHADPSPVIGKDVHIDIKHANIHVQPVFGTPTLTPALTPDDDDIEAMAGKKIFSLERPDDKARELAAKLTLEQQVRDSLFFFCTGYLGAAMGPPLFVHLPFSRCFV
jgi:hypothetical protein